MKLLAAIIGGGLGFWFFFYAYPVGHPVYLSASFSDQSSCQAASHLKAVHGYQVTVCHNSEIF
jgi:hypothetical protein